MKKIIYFAALLFVLSTAKAQNPAFEVATNNVSITLGANATYTDTVRITNLRTTMDLDLEWQLTDITVNTDWFYQMCDHSSCINLVNPSTGQPNPNIFTPTTLTAGQNSFFKIIVDSGPNAGSAIVEIKVWEKNNREETEETILYDVNNSVSSLEAAFDANVKVFPTQVDQTLYMATETGVLDRGVVSIVDLQGRVLRRQSIVPGPMVDIDLSNLESGLYFLRYQTGEQLISRKFIKE